MTQSKVTVLDADAFCEAFLAAFPTKAESGPLACDDSNTWALF